MANVTLLTADDLKNLLSRIDGDADVTGFSGFELIILVAHLKQTGQLEFMSEWYQLIFDTMVSDGLIDQEGNIKESLYTVFWETASMPLYSKPKKDDDE